MKKKKHLSNVAVNANGVKNQAGGARRILFLANPKAGLRAYSRTLAEVDKTFVAPQWQASSYILCGPGEAFRLARQAAEKNYYAVAVLGGDGTINEVVRALAGTQTRLAVIPSGTGNGFARGMGLPLEHAKACQVLQAGKEKSIDVGLVNEKHHFANICGVGYDAWVAKTSNELRFLSRWHGLVRYMVSGFFSLFSYRPRRLRIMTDQETWEQEVLLLAISNTPQYGLNVTIAPGADPGDGHFNLVVVAPLNPLEFMESLYCVFKGKPLRKATYRMVSRLKVETTDGTEMYLHVDGEPAGALPLEASIQKASLKVMVP